MRVRVAVRLTGPAPVPCVRIGRALVVGGGAKARLSGDRGLRQGRRVLSLGHAVVLSLGKMNVGCYNVT